MNKDVEKILETHYIQLNQAEKIFINFELGFFSIKEKNIEKTFSIPYGYSRGCYLYFKNYNPQSPR